MASPQPPAGDEPSTGRQPASRSGRTESEAAPEVEAVFEPASEDEVMAETVAETVTETVVEAVAETKTEAGSAARVAREEEIVAAHVDGVAPRLAGRVTLVEPDPDWPVAYEREAAGIRAVLPENVRRVLEHVGSTSVPGLVAKPVLDMLLAVPDATREADYVPALERAGYVLRIREPDWFEHRLLRRADGTPQVNLHVFSADCPEVRRMLLFRDTLREVPGERELYATTKRELATRNWEFTQNYADAKNAVVDDILHRAGWPGERRT